MLHICVTKRKGSSYQFNPFIALVIAIFTIRFRIYLFLQGIHQVQNYYQNGYSGILMSLWVRLLSTSSYLEKLGFYLFRLWKFNWGNG